MVEKNVAKFLLLNHKLKIVKKKKKKGENMNKKEIGKQNWKNSSHLLKVE